MTWAPTEASILGQTATISTFEKGRPRNHLLARVLGLTAVRVVSYGLIGAFLLSMGYSLLGILTKLPDLAFMIYILMIVGGLYLSLAIFFGVYAKIAMKLEAIQMTDTGIKIQSGELVKTAAWQEIQEIKVSFTSWLSVYYLGGIPGEKTPVIYIKTANWIHCIEWWRYPEVERKQAFLYILRRVVPHNVRILDDFGWVPIEYANYPNKGTAVGKEYSGLKKVGYVLMGIGGLIMLIGTIMWRGDVIAFGIAPGFMGLMIWVAGLAGEDELKKKKEKEKLQWLERQP
jgi:hypothetical protein